MNVKQNRTQSIIKALDKTGATTQACSRCNHNQFQFAGETLIALQNSPGAVVIGGPAIPVAIVLCSKCGNIWQHALGPLGMNI